MEKSEANAEGDRNEEARASNVKSGGEFQG